MCSWGHEGVRKGPWDGGEESGILKSEQCFHSDLVYGPKETCLRKTYVLFLSWGRQRIVTRFWSCQQWKGLGEPAFSEHLIRLFVA